MICRVICDLFCYHLFVGNVKILHKVKHDQFFVRTIVYQAGLRYIYHWANVQTEKKYFLKLLIKSYNSNQ